MSRFWKLTGLIAAVSVGLDVAFAGYGHPEVWWHSVPGFDLAYGFAGCAAIVLFAKWLGHALLMRDEDYYERDR